MSGDPVPLLTEYFDGRSMFGASFATSKYRTGRYAVAVHTRGRSEAEMMPELIAKFRQWEAAA